ncbi:hypothetical protein CDAR_511481 [Caerostris darwini]|uniref:Uncharacterized protein n=1 Tax=Caerostris darwini TaxID=1538125 RepID=A0AAV4UD82_9ARAC|nr:hypothetical protein CDAR_511481 [Caerostris darwini]
MLILVHLMQVEVQEIHLAIDESRFPPPRIPEGMVECLHSLPNAASELRVPSGLDEIARFGRQHSFLLLSNSSFISGKSELFSRFIPSFIFGRIAEKRSTNDREIRS